MPVKPAVLNALIALSLVLVTACSAIGGSPLSSVLPQPEPAATPALPPPTATPRPSPDATASAYFQAWTQGQYALMYDLLSAAAKSTISQDVFVRRYTNIRDGLSVSKIDLQSQPATVGPPPAPATSSASQVPASSPVPAIEAIASAPFQVTWHSAIVPDIVESKRLPLVQEQGAWRVAWDPSLIFNGLTATATVRAISDDGPRGRILDRNGKPLADNGAILAVGVVPGDIKDENAMVKALSDTLKLDPAAVKKKYQGGQPDWFMPIVVRPLSDEQALQQALGSVPGVELQHKPARVYPLGDAAAHVVGYITHVTADDLKQLAEKGYTEDDWVGRAGIEAWGEAQLAGQKGGRVIIADDKGRVVRTIAERKASPGADIRLSLDAGIQAQAAKALGDRIGSVVVVDPRDNSLLALTSRPSFDPSKFILGLTDAEWQAMNGPNRPLILRATESAYPTGSTFKVITMAAGMEKGSFKTSDTFNCALDWNGLPGVTLHNWEPQGILNLPEALTESCNPAFYTIGLKLDRIDPDILPTFARAFGLGQPTGIQGVPEVAGTVPDPAWKQQQEGQPWTAGDAVNLAIGQGYLLATPLQLANAYAALARGGARKTPVLVKAVVRPDGTQQAPAAQDKGTLPIGAATRAAILEGMKRVPSTPAGTAYYAFKDEKTSTAAKTGSAENENPDAHAWFAGWQTADRPTTLTIVMVEGGQHGSTVAAPIARQVLDFAFPLAR
ncbi:MAG: penicillin-binding protein 2 [Chloroflexi bacterium]|nr:penicillin-binding protein 2 [Chloroflexota bacterium]